MIQYAMLKYSTICYITRCYTTLQDTIIHYNTLHYPTLHYRTLHYTTVCYLLYLQGCQHWKMKNRKISTDVILGGLGVFPPKNINILNVLLCIFDASVIDFYIFFSETSLHFFLLQIIHSFDMRLMGLYISC